MLDCFLKNSNEIQNNWFKLFFSLSGTDYAFADTGLNIQQQQQADTTDKTRYGYILGPSDLMEKEKLIGIREINR